VSDIDTLRGTRQVKMRSRSHHGQLAHQSHAPQLRRRECRSGRSPSRRRRLEGLQIGARVKHARLPAGIRMRELVEKVGCTESTVSKIEAGRVVPSLQMLHRLVALDRDMASLFDSDPRLPVSSFGPGSRR
jgi:ribosome-binding protein aMBF1 (putative translation factor)